MKNIAILLFLSLMSCKENKTKVIISKENDIQLKTKVVEQGDENAFTDLILKIGNSSSQYEILPYAMIMANKHNSGEGCYQVLLGIMSVNNPGKYGYNPALINKFSDIDKKTVLFYLQKGTNLKNINCVLALEEIYRNGWGVDKNSKKADDLRKEYNSISK